MVILAMVIFLQGRTYPAFIGTWALFGLGVGLLSPAYQSLVSKVVPRQSLGTFSGLFQGSVGLISLPAPWIGAQLWERFNPRLPFLLTAIGAAITLPVVWWKFKLPKAPPEAEAELAPVPVEVE
jgi:MFS family permease